MNEKEIMQAFQRPFAASEVEWRVQRCGITKGKPWAFVLCYVTNRAIQMRSILQRMENKSAGSALQYGE